LATLYISPTGSGTRDGSSLANAGTISNLSSFIGKAGAGGQVLLRADQGAYNLSGQITIKSGGSTGAPVTIRGVDASGNTKLAQINGTRAVDWTTGKPEGSEVFRLLSGADHLKFQNMTFKNIGNGAFRIGSDIKDLTLEHMQATNVKRFLDDTASTGYSSASVDGLAVRDVDVYGYSENAIKLKYNSHNIVIEDVMGQGDPNTPEQYVSGILLDGTAHDVLFKNVTMKDSYARGSSDQYWNGDGFTTEGGTYNIRFENTVASGNTDAGYDLKSSNTVLVNALAEGNNRGYRFWSSSNTMENSQSLNPKHFGGSASTDHIWLAEGAHAKVIGGVISDQNSGLTVFDLWKSGGTLEVNGTTINTYGKILGLGSNSQLLINEGSNTLHGTAGNETLNGTSTKETIYGYGGDDRLIGKAGNDILSGGAGKDAFVFNTNPSTTLNRDKIVDFNVVDDTIHLENAVFTKLAAGNLSASLFRAGDKALDANDHIIYNSSTGVLSYDADGNGAGAAVQVATFSNYAKLTAGDFYVI
jgi:Ca2+-binding RTX toxin-like protein